MVKPKLGKPIPKKNSLLRFSLGGSGTPVPRHSGSRVAQLGNYVLGLCTFGFALPAPAREYYVRYVERYLQQQPVTIPVKKSAGKGEYIASFFSAEPVEKYGLDRLGAWGLYFALTGTFLAVVCLVYIIWKWLRGPTTGTEKSRPNIHLTQLPNLNGPGYDDDHNCPICQVTLRHPVRYNCNHAFCASCCLTTFCYGKSVEHICSICRGKITSVKHDVEYGIQLQMKWCEVEDSPLRVAWAASMDFCGVLAYQKIQEWVDRPKRLQGGWLEVWIEKGFDLIGKIKVVSEVLDEELLREYEKLGWWRRNRGVWAGCEEVPQKKAAGGKWWQLSGWKDGWKRKKQQ